MVLSKSGKAIVNNNLLSLSSEGKVCKVFGVKLVATNEIVQIARTAGYDALFIDLEHSALTVKDANQLSTAALCTGITPFVRIPHECGFGLIQKVLDVGAMGIIFPHIHGVEDAKRAIEITKYAPLGKRSLTMGFPHFGYSSSITASTIMSDMNESGSTAIIMIETADALEKVDEIAALPGCDVLLLGPHDLCMELGILGDFDSPTFDNAVRKVSEACKKHGKIMGIGGLYQRPDLLKKIINEYGAKFVMGAQDAGLLTAGTKTNCELLDKIPQ